MSCLDVMYHHQAYGVHPYLPSPASACSTAFCQQQQKRLAVHTKMQEALEPSQVTTKQEEEEKEQPAEMEYLNSRCVLFTYFQGDIGSVVDEHFSRALSQASSFNAESSSSKAKTGANPLWRDSSTISSQRSGFPSSFWTSSYQPPPPPCLGAVHPDLPVTAAGAFSTTDLSSWHGHSLHQSATSHPHAVSETWHYPLTAQANPSYAHMHDVYMHHHHAHPHMHHHHHHPGSHLDPRYGSILMPSVRAARIPAPQCDIAKTDAATATTSTSAWSGAFHGTVDIVPNFSFESGFFFCGSRSQKQIFSMLPHIHFTPHSIEAERLLDTFVTILTNPSNIISDIVKDIVLCSGVCVGNEYKLGFKKLMQQRKKE